MNDIVAPNINWDTDTIVSYTQFSMYQKCPKSWELAYARKLRKKEPNIHLVFGTAIHTTIQEWLANYYAGNSYDYVSKFREYFQRDFEQSVTKWGNTFSNPDELMEFYQDGVAILQYMDDHMKEYFDRHVYEYIGYELPIYTVVNENLPTVKLLAYLDLVFRNKKTMMYEVRDIKTSTKGWGTYEINDKSKLSQVLLYKYYFSKIYDVDICDVIVDYFIVKRKFPHEWDTERIQAFVPQQYEDDCAWTVMEFDQFVVNSFNSDGSPNLERVYEARSGRNGSNCRFCEFADREDLCPMAKRLSG